jgi:hypothetical protein
MPRNLFTDKCRDITAESQNTERINAAIVTQRLGKHASAATITHATTEKPSESPEAIEARPKWFGSQQLRVEISVGSRRSE